MDEKRNDLRTEFLAILSASRELDPRIDPHLADVFVDRVHAAYGRQPTKSWMAHPGRVFLPALATIALLSFLLGISIPGHDGDSRVVPAAPAHIFGDHDWSGPFWHGPPAGSAEPHRSV